MSDMQIGTVDKETCAAATVVEGLPFTASPGPRALLCSQNREDEHVFTSVLCELGVDLAALHRPQDAVGLAGRERFAVILLNLDCDSDWKATLQALRTQAGSVPVVAYSRLPDEYLWVDALEAGAFDFLGKPFSRRELQSMLAKALAGCGERHFDSSIRG